MYSRTYCQSNQNLVKVSVQKLNHLHHHEYISRKTLDLEVSNKRKVPFHLDTIDYSLQNDILVAKRSIHCLNPRK